MRVLYSLSPSLQIHPVVVNACLPPPGPPLMDGSPGAPSAVSAQGS